MLLTPSLPSRWVIATADTVDDPDILPHLIGVGFPEKYPLWSSAVKTSVSGVERRRALWSYPVWQFKFGYEVLRDAATFLELQRLRNFFNSKSGSTTGFFYFDRDDYSVVNNRFGTGDGITTKFQLTRTSAVGSISFTEPVRGLASNPTIYVNGVATTAFTVGDLGNIIFTTPPSVGAVLSWSGTFFFMCRFEKDDLQGLIKIADGLWNLNDLSFRSFKP